MSSDGEPRISFAVGPDGWVAVTWKGRTTYVRFALNRDRKTFRIVELRMLNPKGEDVRSLPLARIETAANASGIVLAGLAIGIKTAAPADVPAFFRRSRKHFEASQAAGRYLLERPVGRRLDDGFYVRVAKAYRDAAALGLNPRQTLARDSGAAPDTVARWVAGARRRGYLPKTQPGKVTA